MIRRLEGQNLAILRGDRLLFEGLNFTLEAGQAMSLVGRNGAGKTSLLRAIAGFLRPLQGTIAFHGSDGVLEPDEARAGALHMAGHHDGLKSNRLARDEFLFQARWTGAEEAGIARARALFDLDGLTGLEVRKLSAGQRRRLSLGRLVAQLDCAAFQRASSAARVRVTDRGGPGRGRPSAAAAYAAPHA